MKKTNEFIPEYPFSQGHLRMKCDVWQHLKQFGQANHIRMETNRSGTAQVVDIFGTDPYNHVVQVYRAHDLTRISSNGT
jgi:hypothetical protein